MSISMRPQLKSLKSSLALLSVWAEMVKLEHTIFGLPFALSGLLLAAPTLPSWQTVVWTILAFTGARAAAMTLNRLIDAQLDAANPRTRQRAIPQGIIRKKQALAFAVGSFAVMLYAASHLPPLCLMLSPLAILWLTFYSYTKRFTWLCHFALGIAIGGAALGGWLAAAGNLAGGGPWLLALAVSSWVAGFDIIYACQDTDFDQEQKLFSLPARYGIAPALGLSFLLHVVSVITLVILAWYLHLGLIFYSGIVLVALMLIWEHHLVKAQDLSSLNVAFFNVNGLVSISMFLAALLDKLI